ncbi:hypothetical protein KC19_1G289000 [Ceratodon purpureus]|uniref:Polyketide cyclase/dehydrase n=1 Tax=Ceratodon purpureus TaxID=3225 RepID=A0A8T0JE01_CERPU|nr:hypothetical protein KC19_1G289000 [Ceratodon purpureus]
MAPYVAKAEILINAPIDLIWSINLDLAKYKEWNPFIVCVTNIPPQLAVGSKITLHARFSDGTKSTSQEAVTDLVPPYMNASAGGVCRAVLAYKYSGLLPHVGLVNGTRYQWLEQKVNSGTTFYRTEETFTGPGAVLVPVEQVQDGFQRHAIALRDRAEAFSRT